MNFTNGDALFLTPSFSLYTLVTTGVTTGDGGVDGGNGSPVCPAAGADAGLAAGPYLSACGGLAIFGTPSCELVASGCSTQCAPPNLASACAADLAAECSSGCTATLPSCAASCESSSPVILRGGFGGLQLR